MLNTNWWLKIFCALLMGASVADTSSVQVGQTVIGTGLPILTGIYKKAYGTTVVGSVDLYTAPTGKRAAVLSWQLSNQSGGTAVVFSQLKNSGTYYRLCQSTSIANLALLSTISGTGGSAVFQIVLEPGESFAVSSDRAGAYTYAKILEFDSSVRFYCPKLLSLAAGDNTLYTVPANSSAIVLQVNNTNAASPIPMSHSIGSMVFSNSSGATRTIATNLVASGGAPGAANLTISAISVTNNNVSYQMVAPTMTAGDFLSINTDANTATQIAYACLAETSN